MSIIEFKKKPEVNADIKLIDAMIELIETVMDMDNKIASTMARPYLACMSDITMQFEITLVECTKAMLFKLKEEVKEIKEINDEVEFRNYMVLVESFMSWYERKEPNAFHATTLIDPDADFGNGVTQYIFALTSDHRLVLLDIFSEKGNLVSMLMNKFHQDGLELVFGN